ncbi:MULTISPECIES: hypothetical protein [Vibrio]|uniref:hypothetical protein n=1 Tax=Vibrio TaxID=662 RepID=UPI00178C8DD4|nr:hypothetical protein [Vibrio lentus]CAH6798798.1 conserved hypothetical protein [Vibrio chagasii]MDN3630800.1 hypothetical protein [Vibrio lentus]CAH6799786.1 conserved hypothetical protein [Vibrio chagasii]CAH6943063.1 conserved hypothetical protein [Vibrio chagasii]CAH7135767.1 conserved hypothetical protein [Vibrio chagasii]
MTMHQQSYQQLVSELELVEQTLTQAAPDWSTVPTLKKPLVAIQAAEEASQQVATTIHLLKSLMNNFHLRLCELEATHGQ